MPCITVSQRFSTYVRRSKFEHLMSAASTSLEHNHVLYHELSNLEHSRIYVLLILIQHSLSVHHAMYIAFPHQLI